MRGSAVPVASAGSKNAGVNDTCTPQVITPSAPHPLRGANSTAAAAVSAPANRSEELTRMQSPLSVDPRAAQKGPDARRPLKAAGEAYPWYVEPPAEGANEADGPFSAARSAAGLRSVGVDTMLLQLLPQRIPVDAQELGRPHLIALGLAHDGAQEGLLHEPHHQPVQVGRGLAAHAAHALNHLPLDDLLERRIGRHPRRPADEPDGHLL